LIKRIGIIAYPSARASLFCYPGAIFRQRVLCQPCSTFGPDATSERGRRGPAGQSIRAIGRDLLDGYRTEGSARDYGIADAQMLRNAAAREEENQ
jgi:hypothetical protein